jgi:hypothetical protein
MQQHVASLIAVALLSSALTAPRPQPAGVAEIAAKMSGRWKLNVELSPGLGEQAPAGRGGRGGGTLFALAASPPQRGRANMPSEPGIELPMMTDEERAAQQALAAIQQVPPELTIEASPAEMKTIEPRGESVFKIDGKNATVPVPGSTIKVKSRWDRSTLRQEFSSAMRTLKRAWSIDANGRLVLTQHSESIRGSTKPVVAIFDRQS